MDRSVSRVTDNANRENGSKNTLKYYNKRGNDDRKFHELPNDVFG